MLIFSLCFLLFINAMSIGLVFPIFALLFFEQGSLLFAPGASLHLKTLTYSLILALPNICMILGAPFLGRMSDHHGRKFVLVLGLCGVACSFFLSSAAISMSSLILLYFSRALAGFMDGSEAVAQAAIADISRPHEKARHMGYATFAGTIGFIIGPILGGLLAEPALTGTYHFQIPFLASCLLTVINALILVFYFPQRPHSHDYPKKISYLALLGKGFVIAWDKRIRRYSLLLFILQGSLATFAQVCTIFLVKQFNYSSWEVGLYTTFLGACFSGGIFLVIHVLLDRFNHTHLLRWGIGFTVLSFVIALAMHTSALFPWISVVPLMLGIALMYNVLLSFVSNAVSDREQGDAMGSGTALKALGWLISSLLVGWLYPNLIALFLLLLASGLVSLITARKVHSGLGKI